MKDATQPIIISDATPLIALAKIGYLLGFPVIGTVGILILSKELKLIISIKPLLNQLQVEGIHLSRRLVSYALRVANES